MVASLISPSRIIRSTSASEIPGHHILLFMLPVHRATSEAGGEENVETLSAIAISLEEVAGMDHLCGLEAGLLAELASCDLERIGPRLAFPGTLGNLPVASANGVAILLDEMHPATLVDRNDGDEVGFLHHAIDAVRAVAITDPVLPQPHPPALIDDACGKGLDIGRI